MLDHVFGHLFTALINFFVKCSRKYMKKLGSVHKKITSVARYFYIKSRLTWWKKPIYCNCCQCHYRKISPLQEKKYEKKLHTKNSLFGKYFRKKGIKFYIVGALSSEFPKSPKCHFGQHWIISPFNFVLIFICKAPPTNLHTFEYSLN